MPAGEFGCEKSSPVGGIAPEKRALEMATPTNTASPPLVAVEHPPAPPCLADPSSGSINHSGSTGGTSTATHALPRSQGPRNNRSTVLGSTSNIQGKYGWALRALIYPGGHSIFRPP